MIYPGGTFHAQLIIMSPDVAQAMLLPPGYVYQSVFVVAGAHGEMVNGGAVVVNGCLKHLSKGILIE